MSLWGSSTSAESRPKFLPIDSNAAGSGGARENAIAVAGGWGLTPGLAASGNDNKAAQPEVLVCISNFADVLVLLHQFQSGGQKPQLPILEHLILLSRLMRQLMLHLLLGLQIRLLLTRHIFYCLVWVQLIWLKTVLLCVPTTLARVLTKLCSEEH